MKKTSRNYDSVSSATSWTTIEIYCWYWTATWRPLYKSMEMRTQLRPSREEQLMWSIQIVIVEVTKRLRRSQKQTKVATIIIMTSRRQSRRTTKTRVRLGTVLNLERTTRCRKRTQTLTLCTMTMRKIELNCRQYTWQLSIKVKSCTRIYYSA